MRDKSLDIVKGWSVLAIMLLHYEAGIFPEVVNSWVGSFMVSAFYMTAACVMTMRPLPALSLAYKKLWSGLGIPYITFSLLICIFTALMCICGWMEWKILLRDIWKFISLRGIGTLWFLPALFFGELIFIYFMKKGIIGKTLIFAVTIIYFSIYNRWYDNYREISDIYKIIDAPLNAVNRILGAWIAIVIFYVFAKRFKSDIDLLSMKEKIFLGIIILSLFTGMIYKNIITSFGFLTGYLGPIGWLCIAKALQEISIFKFLEYCGRNSLIIMALHFSIIQQVCIIINYHLTGEPSLSGWLSIGYFIISIVILIPCISLIRLYPVLLTGHIKNDKPKKNN